MIVYGFPVSPYVRKVLVVAEEKGVAVEMPPMTPGKPSPEFLAASPFGKIPAIRDGDFTLADSSAIAHYFEAKYPSPALLPADAEGKGRAIWLDEYADTIIATNGTPIIFNRFVAPKLLGRPGDEEAAAKGEEAIKPAMDYLERIVPDDGYIYGEYTLGDIAVASILTTLSYCCEPLGPRARAWLERVYARPAWQAVRAREKAVVEAVFGVSAAS